MQWICSPGFAPKSLPRCFVTSCLLPKETFWLGWFEALKPSPPFFSRSLPLSPPLLSRAYSLYTFVLHLFLLVSSLAVPLFLRLFAFRETSSPRRFFNFFPLTLSPLSLPSHLGPSLWFLFSLFSYTFQPRILEPTPFSSPYLPTIWVLFSFLSVPGFFPPGSQFLCPFVSSFLEEAIHAISGLRDFFFFFFLGFCGLKPRNRLSSPLVNEQRVFGKVIPVRGPTFCRQGVLPFFSFSCVLPKLPSGRLPHSRLFLPHRRVVFIFSALLCFFLDLFFWRRSSLPGTPPLLSSQLPGFSFLIKSLLDETHPLVLSPFLHLAVGFCTRLLPHRCAKFVTVLPLFL